MCSTTSDWINAYKRERESVLVLAEDTKAAIL